MTAPVVAVGDGALGGGNAVGEGWPETRAPRGWVPRRAPGRDTWPKRRPPNATHAVPERINAAPRGDAEAAITAVTAAYQAQEPNAGRPPWTATAAEFIEGDVRDRATMTAALKDIDVVFHQAAYGGYMPEMGKYVAQPRISVALVVVVGEGDVTL